jgi:hypothetical protein
MIDADDYQLRLPNQWRAAADRAGIARTDQADDCANRGTTPSIKPMNKPTNAIPNQSGEFTGLIHRGEAKQKLLLCSVSSRIFTIA